MRCTFRVARLISVGILECLLLDSRPAAVAAELVLIARPDAFKTLVNPPCSYCVNEAKRRAGELKSGDPVLAWTRRDHEGGRLQVYTAGALDAGERWIVRGPRDQITLGHRGPGSGRSSETPYAPLGRLGSMPLVCLDRRIPGDTAP